jgi:hypothetical protein
MAPNRDKEKYPMDDIEDPTPCTLMYVKGRTSRTIEVAKSTVMPSRILHGWPIPTECAVVEVTTIRDSHKFKDLDYPDEDEGIEKLVDAKGTFILWPVKILLSKPIRRWLFHHGAQRLGAFLLQTYRSLFKMNIHQWLLLLLKTVKTQSSRRARGEGRLLLLLKSLKAQSSRTTMSVGHLLLLLETLKAQSSKTTMSIGHLLLLLETLKAQSSKTTMTIGHLLLLLETLKAQSLGRLLLLLKS